MNREDAAARDAGENLIADAIAPAEEIRDPLDDLVARSGSDPGLAFMPEVLKRLASLRKNDRAAFEALRAHLKGAGCRVTALDEAIAEQDGKIGGRGPKQADILIDLAQAADLFHSPDGNGLADFDINGHRETWPIRSKGFRRWLARRYFETTAGAPSSEALQSALNVIEAKAHFDAPERAVSVRVAAMDSKIYIDLCDHAWRAVEVDPSGWRVVDNPPVRFRRASGMKALPAPARGGSIVALRSFLNVQSDADFVLIVAWILAAMRDKPSPIARSRPCAAAWEDGWQEGASGPRRRRPAARRECVDVRPRTPSKAAPQDGGGRRGSPRDSEISHDRQGPAGSQCPQCHSGRPGAPRRTAPRPGRSKAGEPRSRLRSRADRACRRSKRADPTHCRRRGRDHWLRR
jgi:hypothetical protein